MGTYQKGLAMPKNLSGLGFTLALKAYPNSECVLVGEIEHWFQLVPVPDEGGQLVLEERITTFLGDGGVKFKHHWEFLGVA
jgi:hypothetical protein